MWTRTFWIEALERAIKTLAQTMAALLVGDGLGILVVDWKKVLSVAALAAVVSMFTSLGSAELGKDKDSPSLV